jgi:hypothetical protein
MKKLLGTQGRLYQIRNSQAAEIAVLVDNLHADIIDRLKNNPFDNNIDTIESLITPVMDMVKGRILSAVGSALSEADQSLLLAHFKEIYKDQGIVLRTNRKIDNLLFTIEGSIVFRRLVLRPKTEEDKISFLNLENKTSVIPLDEVLKVSD